MSDHNGWSNRETWCANLYLDNDRGSYFETQYAIAQGLLGAAEFANEFPEVTVHVYRHVSIHLEEMMGEWLDNRVEFSDGSAVDMFLDIGSFWRIDFDEIAKAKLDLFPVELLQPKNGSDLVRSERPLGAPVPTCPDCGVAVVMSSDDWHFCDWQPVAVDVLGLEFSGGDLVDEDTGETFDLGGIPIVGLHND